MIIKNNMANQPHYTIKNSDIAKDLLAQGFALVQVLDGNWILEFPKDISSTKARKIISVCIKLYKAAKTLNKAKSNYDFLVDKINKINMSR